MKGMAAKIEALMSDPAPQPLVSAATLLAALSAVYGGAVLLRADLYRCGLLARRRLPCRVVSVGNLTAGGTGKTPMTMDLAVRLRDRGWPVCVLSRGYRGAAERTGAVVGDGRRILVSPAVAGDEPWLMARRLAGVPVIVGSDRWKSAMTAVRRFGARVVILDDGFQHLALARDLDLLLFDAGNPLGSGHLLPRGPLREPPTAARRAHALVRIHRGPAAGNGASFGPGSLRPLLDARLHPFLAMMVEPGRAPRATADLAGALCGRKVAAFAGVAGNRAFFDALTAMGADVVERLGFADHHPYRPVDLERIRRAARRAGADCVATTAKDHARLGGAAPPDLPLAVVDLAVTWADGGAMIDRLLDRCMGPGPCPEQRDPSSSTDGTVLDSGPAAPL